MGFGSVVKFSDLSWHKYLQSVKYLDSKQLGHFRKCGGLKLLTLGWNHDQSKLFLPKETRTHFLHWIPHISQNLVDYHSNRSYFYFEMICFLPKRDIYSYHFCWNQWKRLLWQCKLTLLRNFQRCCGLTVNSHSIWSEWVQPVQAQAHCVIVTSGGATDAQAGCI